MKQRILITGGLGFVGSELLYLTSDQFETRFTNIDVLDNLISGYTTHIPREINFIYGDIRNDNLMRELIPQYDYVVHLAGIVGAPACSINDRFAFDCNVTGTQNIIRHLTMAQKFIFISSSSAYGQQSERVTEQTELNPLTNYGVHKAVGETLTRNGKAQYIILRPATSFGVSSKTRLDVLPNTLSYIALTKGIIDLFEPHVIRPFIHVSDFAGIIIHALKEYMPWNEVYNIGDPSITLTKQQLAEQIASECSATVVPREGSDPDKRNYDVSFDKLMKTGYKFNPDPLKTAVYQIRNKLSMLQADPESFSTPYQVERYLRAHKYDTL